VTKFNFGINTSKGLADLASLCTTRNGSLYITPCPPDWGSTGFNASFHPGETHLKTYNPLKTVPLRSSGPRIINGFRDFMRQNTTTLSLHEEPGQCQGVIGQT
jgi:hypothetical protein